MRAWFLAGLGVLLASVVAAAPAFAGVVTLSGEVTYRERIALPPGATLRIMLVDLTESGSPARVDVRAPVGTPGQVPLSFNLSFDELALVPDHEHGVIAEILAGDVPWFRNEVPYRLDPVAPATPVTIITTQAQQATAAPAVPSGNPPAAEPTALTATTWRAVEISGTAVAPDVDSTLAIGADSRAGGRGGCNNYFAQAEISGMNISLGPIAATRMACVSETANAQETAYFAALGAIRNWQTDEDGALVFLDAEGDVVVRFVPMTR